MAQGSRTDGLLSRIGLNDNKAGMEGLDRDKINKIILEASKGSRFYENELKKEQQVNQRIERMMQQKDNITHTQLRNAQAEVERLRAALERGRDLSRVIVHVDMDAFYAAVEMRDQPELKEKPMAVGSSSMLSTSNYHARKFGVRAAMPGFIARKLCPNLVIVPTNFDKYRAVSSEIREIFSDYDPHFQPVSLDEAYLDLTEHLEQRAGWPESLRTHCYTDHGAAGTVQGEVQISPPAQDTAELSPLLFDDSPTPSGESGPGFQGSDSNGSSSSGESAPGFQVFGTSAEEAVREMRFRIQQKTQLTASAGIAPNMLLAKVCSDLNKPNGQYVLSAHTPDIMGFINELPVRKVCGIGKVSEKLLGALGITSCSHLGQQMGLLSLLFSESSWQHFLRISLGLGATHLERDGERKSMSTERTFRELNKAEDQMSLCRELCEDLSNDLNREGLKGKTVTLKLKNVQFEVRTRACSLPCAVSSAQEIYSVANQLLRTEMDSVKPLPLRLRLMGVRISSFISSEDRAPQQRSIMGFLQPGGVVPPPDLPVPPSASPQLGRTEPAAAAHHLHHSSAPSPPAHLSSRGSSIQSTQLPSGQQQQHPLQALRQPLGVVQPPGPGHQQQSSRSQVGQSFFQRALAQRLSLQAEEEEEDRRSTSSPDTRHTHMKDTHTVRSWDSMKDTDRKRDTDMKDTDMKDTDMKETDSSVSSVVSSTSADPSLQASLPCPVCFRQVYTTDLDVFNRHVDVCLSAGAWPPVATETHLDTPGTSTTHLDVSSTTSTRLDPPGTSSTHLASGCGTTQSEPLGGVWEVFEAGGGKGNPGDWCVSDTSQPSLTTEENSGSSAEQWKDAVPSEPQRSGTNHGGHAPQSVTSSQQGHAPQSVTSSQQKAESLTCPVCQVTQSCDLSVFNRHIDLCLNQEVLTQIKGQRSLTSSTQRSQGAKGKERVEPQPGTSNKNKGKRRHSPQCSPAKKKSKALNPSHLSTIDRFFR